MPLLNVIFPHETVNQIVSIHIPWIPRSDKLVWSLERNEIYSMKSAYILAGRLVT